MVTKRKLKIPIFNYYMTILIYDYWEDLIDYIPKEVYDDPGKGVTIEYDNYCVVCCPTNSGSTIAHESGHIANLVWKYIGYTPMRDNDEVNQYLVAYIYEEIEKVINKHLVK